MSGDDFLLAEGHRLVEWLDEVMPLERGQFREWGHSLAFFLAAVRIWHRTQVTDAAAGGPLPPIDEGRR